MPFARLHARSLRGALTVVALVSPVLSSRALAQSSGSGKATIEQFMSPASPLTLASARKADRIAWMVYDRGLRNVYTAAAPDFRAARVTSFLKDDGTDLTDVELSDDGSIIVFVRGSAPNRFGWVANPSHDPNGAERAIWAVRASGGPAWRVAQGAAPELSPDGRTVLFTRDGQIYRARVMRRAIHSGLGPQRIAHVVARRQAHRLRERSGESCVHRRV
jgi:hypothetical protein